MSRIHTDLSRIPISVAPDPATSGTSLGVTDANAAILPDTYPYWAVLVPTGAAPTRSNSEIVKVTGGSSSGGTTTLTIVRAQGVPVTTAQTVTTSFDIYDANSVEALPQVSSDVTETPSGTVNSSNTTFTLTTAPATGTLKLYQNGVRLKITDDYTLSGSTITFVTAPTTGDTLLADYNIISGTFSTGSTSFVYNEVPSGLVNGSNTAYDTAHTYVAGTIQVYRDGQLMKGGGADYTETDSNTITFTTAPVTGSVILVTYQSAVSTAGNADTLDGYHANATPTAGQIPVLNAVAQLPGTALAAPQGFLLNGKIVPSVASNNLTVAIKGIDGNDPSATNPVYCRIGDTVRSITAALSVTKNAGTNWFNSGGTPLATKEVDYFVYLGYNATDGVVIGFSAYPGAYIYSDFSATSTNQKYCAISTITNAAAGDNYEVIGRFAATLSAGAGYTWTVPTFTNINLIQRQTRETRQLEFNVLLPGDGSMTTTSITPIECFYQIFGNVCRVHFGRVQCTTGGTLTPTIVATLPKTTAVSNNCWGGASAYTNSAYKGAEFTESTTTSVQIRLYDSSNWTAGSSYFGGELSFTLG